MRFDWSIRLNIATGRITEWLTKDTTKSTLSRKEDRSRYALPVFIPNRKGPETDDPIRQMIPRLRHRAAIRVAAAFHSASAEDVALLRQLATALKTNPETAQRLSGLLSPATMRNLSRAMTTVQQPTTEAADAAAIRTGVPQPTIQELKMVALQVGLPFIGFGFVDNFIMIVAGDYIDLTLGVSFGISSMAAAGIGNTISDVAGLGLGNVVEDLCARLGLPVVALTTEQVKWRCDCTSYLSDKNDPGLSTLSLCLTLCLLCFCCMCDFQTMLKRTRIAKVVGSSVGVTIGCLLGMAPLLFLHTREQNDGIDVSKATP